MNLLNIRTKQWETEIARLTAPDLEKKLGEVTPAHAVLGRIAGYFVARYGFSPDCLVVAFAGALVRARSFTQHSLPDTRTHHTTRNMKFSLSSLSLSLSLSSIDLTRARRRQPQ